MLMKFSATHSLLLSPLLLSRLLLLLFRIPSHYGRDTEIRSALSIRIAVVVDVVQEAAVGRRTGALVVLIPSTRCRDAGGYGRRGGALGLHLPAEENPRVLLVLLTLDSSAGSSSDDVAAERRQGQSVSLPSSKGTRLQQHHLNINGRSANQWQNWTSHSVTVVATT